MSNGTGNPKRLLKEIHFLEKQLLQYDAYSPKYNEINEQIDNLRHKLGMNMYDLYLDVTPDDVLDDFFWKTGVYPSSMIMKTLLEYGYSGEEIQKLMESYELFPTEEIKPLTKKQKEKYPDKIARYKLVRVHPLKYKRVMQRWGFDVNTPYWNYLEEYVNERSKGKRRK